MSDAWSDPAEVRREIPRILNDGHTLVNGDLDGDGVTDMAVGARGHNSNSARGAVHILLLNSNGTVKSSLSV